MRTLSESLGVMAVGCDVASAINTLNFYGLGDVRSERYRGLDIVDELEKLNATPLVRKFIPREVLCCDKYDLLDALKEKVPDSPPGLVSVIRDAAFNLRVWKKIDEGKVDTIDSVTRKGHLGTLLARQNNRCSVCGAMLQSLANGCMHLDHIIPRSLGGGDPPDRSNWRVLCDSCNLGKREHLSAFSVPETWGQPGRTEGREVQSINRAALGNLAEWWEATPRMRYASLALAGGCAECGVTASGGELHVRWDGCPTVPCATVLCGTHFRTV